MIDKIMAWAEGKWIHDPLMLFFMLFSLETMMVWVPKVLGFILVVALISYLVN